MFALDSLQHSVGGEFRLFAVSLKGLWCPSVPTARSDQPTQSAALVGGIATVETEEPAYAKVSNKSAGGNARAEKLSSECRHEIAAAASAARWNERRVR